ncbi:histone-like nucleoid-structuring protein Lsr2 [Rathayibacter sp. AY1E5]|uniref:Lsr2 family DNA-binding protein n=1 Tax=Rathayibacter sp. AY1E5 TaxID=2080553 RepID=UPI0035BE5ABE
MCPRANWIFSENTSTNESSTIPSRLVAGESSGAGFASRARAPRRPASKGQLRRAESLVAAVPAHPPASRAQTNPERLKAIREWASKNGRNVVDRGRMSAEVQKAYNVRTQRSGTR